MATGYKIRGSPNGLWKDTAAAKATEGRTRDAT